MKTLMIILAVMMTTAVGCQKKSNNNPQSSGGGGQGGQSTPVNNNKTEFKSWKAYLGNYYLTQFDGQDVGRRFTDITESLSSFYDKSASKYVDSVIFPLYYSVGANSEGNYNFGPLEGKGESTLVEGEGMKVLTYKYAGPINLQGMDIQMDLDMTVVVEGTNLYVTYTLEVPGHVTKQSHNFTLVK